jgi:hypothetical protein
MIGERRGSRSLGTAALAALCLAVIVGVPGQGHVAAGVDRPSGVAFVQLTAGRCCPNPFFSPDGARVMFLDRPAPDAPAGIWSVAVDQPLSAPALFARRPGPFSRDLALAADLVGGQTIVERLRDGARWVIPNGGRPMSFSPDGRYVAWSVAQGIANFDIRRVEDLAGERRWQRRAPGGRALRRRVRRLDAGWKGLLLSGRRSPQAPQAELTLLDVAQGGERTLLFYERLLGLSASPGGRWLAYLVTQARENGVFVLSLTRPSATPQRLDFFGAYRWRDGDRLLYVPMAPGAASDELWQLDLARGQKQQLIRAEAGSPFKIANNDWAVSPDGSQLVFLSARDRNLWLVKLP